MGGWRGGGGGGQGVAASGPDDSWIDRSRAYVRGLTGRHRQHVVDYTGSDHEIINGWLRDGQMSRQNEDFARSRVKSIDAVLAKSPLTETTHLTRIVSLRDAFGLTDGSRLQGIAGTFRAEDGFISTSRVREFSMKDYRDPVVLDVIAPRGTPAAAIEDISAVPDQFEVLLGREQMYSIVDPVYDDVAHMWRATMLIAGPKGRTS